MGRNDTFNAKNAIHNKKSCGWGQITLLLEERISERKKALAFDQGFSVFLIPKIRDLKEYVYKDNHQFSLYHGSSGSCQQFLTRTK
jgi:hypothetical protein